MREFFRGWKRKVGCVTLGLACVFAIAWIRSLAIFDVMYLPVSSTTTIGLVSAAQAIDFCGCWQLGSNDKFYFATGEVRSTNGSWLDEAGQIAAWSDKHKINWRFECAGIRVGRSRIGACHDFDCILPYWSVVTPLTIFSAWLLLSAPRAKSEPSIAPVSENN